MTRTHLAQAQSEAGNMEKKPLPAKDSSAKENAGKSQISASTDSLRTGALTRTQRETVFNLFLEGQLLEEKGKIEDACSLYLKALELAPHSPVLGAVAANALLQAGKTAAAVQTAESALQEDADNTDALTVIGQAYMADQEWDKAVKIFERIRTIEPRSLDVLSELSNLYLRVQRYDDTLQLLRDMARWFPEQAVFFRLQTAVILYQLNRLDDALREYKTIAEDFPNYSEVHERIGAILYLQGQSDQAIQAFLTALKMVRSPKDEIPIRRRLGDLYREKQAYDEAFTQYQRIQELDPKDRDVGKFLALLRLEQKKYPEALEEINNLVKESPADFRLQQLKLEILKKLDRSKEGYQEYLNAFAQAVQTDQKDQILLFIWDLSQDENLDSISQWNQMDRYQQLLDQAAGKTAKIPRFYFAQAALTQYLKNTNGLQDRLRSILAIIKSVEEKGDSKALEEICLELRLWYRVRNAFFQQQQDRELTVLLEKCRRTFPQNVDLIRTLGLVYMESRNWQLAETAYQEATSLLEKDAPEYKEIRFQLATIYEKINRLADVEIIMKEMMEKYPEDSEAYNFLGYSFADHNVRLDEALSLIEKSLKLDPDNGNILDSLGWVYFRLGRAKEAIVPLERALELEKNHPVILDHLGDVYAANGQRAAAVEKWKKALEFGPRQPFEFTPEFQARIDQKIRETEDTLKP